MKYQGTPPRQKTRRNVMKAAIRNKRPDNAINAAAVANLSKAEAYGYHPTKRGPGR